MKMQPLKFNISNLSDDLDYSRMSIALFDVNMCQRVEALSQSKFIGLKISSISQKLTE